jgi:hypothetical protein
MLIGLHRAGRRHLPLEAAALDCCGAHAQVLGHARSMLTCRAVAAFVGVLRHQLHVHVGRLPGLVELLLRVHRVVPVQDLALGLASAGGAGAGAATEAAAVSRLPARLLAALVPSQ